MLNWIKSKILANVKRQGFKYGEDFTESMINAAIEAAVQGLK